MHILGVLIGSKMSTTHIFRFSCEQIFWEKYRKYPESLKGKIFGELELDYYLTINIFRV